MKENVNKGEIDPVIGLIIALIILGLLALTLWKGQAFSNLISPLFKVLIKTP